MTPGYPKYYIGNSVCRWTLYAKRSQKIKLTILDLALRCKWNSLAKSQRSLNIWHNFCSPIAVDEPCRDYLEIKDLNTNQTLFSGCTESTRPIEVVSLQDRVEVRGFCEADEVNCRHFNAFFDFSRSVQHRSVCERQRKLHIQSEACWYTIQVSIHCSLLSKNKITSHTNLRELNHFNLCSTMRFHRRTLIEIVQWMRMVNQPWSTNQIIL